MNSNPDIEMFYDGDCPLCVRETRMLKRMDRHQRILFTNIADAQFDGSCVGKTHEDLMPEIHGRLPDGSWIKGVEVFHRLYDAVGFGSLVWLTRLPLIKQALGIGYVVFAKNRLRLTGRCNETCTIN